MSARNRNACRCDHPHHECVKAMLRCGCEILQARSDVTEEPDNSNECRVCVVKSRAARELSAALKAARSALWSHYDIAGTPMSEAEAESVFAKIRSALERFGEP